MTTHYALMTGNPIKRENQALCSLCSLVKEINLGPATNLQAIRRTEGRVKLHHECAVSEVQTVGISASQMGVLPQKN